MQISTDVLKCIKENSNVLSNSQTTLPRTLGSIPENNFQKAFDILQILYTGSYFDVSNEFLLTVGKNSYESSHEMTGEQNVNHGGGLQLDPSRRSLVGCHMIGI